MHKNTYMYFIGITTVVNKHIFTSNFLFPYYNKNKIPTKNDLYISD